jgi:hypothetical protein
MPNIPSGLRRYRLPLPPERRAEQPFAINARARRVIAPWREPQPGDEARLDAMLAGLDLAALPATVCWTWADRPPEPVQGAAPNSATRSR